MKIKTQGLDLVMECGSASSEGWRVAQVEVSVPGFNGTYECQLMTIDLVVFQEQMKAMSQSIGRECKASFSTTDPGINIDLVTDALGNIHGQYTLTNFDSFGNPTLQGSFEADQSFLSIWEKELTEEIKK